MAGARRTLLSSFFLKVRIKTLSLIKRLNHLRKDLLAIISPDGAGTAVRPVFRAQDIHRMQSPQISKIKESGPKLPQAVLCHVESIKAETDAAISLIMRRWDGEVFEFIPGMFVTLLIDVDGKSFRRAYSISSPMQSADTITITVKRQPNGRVSNHICDHIKPGDSLSLLTPQGMFTHNPMSHAEKTVLFIGVGSGITPLFSMIQSALLTSDTSQLMLVYGNRSKKDIIYNAELNMLMKEHKGRFTVRHIIKNPERGWRGGRGRLDSETLTSEIGRYLNGKNVSELLVYICGPEAVMDLSCEILSVLGVASSQIHRERYFSPSEIKQDSNCCRQLATIHDGSHQFDVQVEPGQTLLSAGLANGVEIPFSCALGGCGRCRVRILEGEVISAEPNCLTEKERQEGYALACISSPRTAVIVKIES